eukprot:TRINITY_DN40984_c0_g1_i1.p1 TRINITY_DN40984_c0_g1~~TRINITY_DN40984_c0_g1_i1.p1  ORF type:complete len:349 (-),score=69.97 TRINITY_DN40984_c0_g1_i1:154-1101(-)
MLAGAIGLKVALPPLESINFVESDEEEEEEGERGLPEDIDAWGKKLEKRWAERRESVDLSSWQREASKVKMLIGIPSCPSDVKPRQYIKKTWAQQPGVCLYSNKAVRDSKCKVLLQFVLGTGNIKGSQEVQVRVQGDEVLLAVDDGSKSYGDGRKKAGSWKNYNYFKYASRAYPWATHIGLVDQDFLPPFHSFVPAVAKLGVSPDKYQYLGRSLKGHACFYPMSMIESNAVENHTAGKDAFHCVIGLLWLQSRKLAYDITDDKNRNLWGQDDLFFGENDRNWGHVISRFAAQGHHVETFTVATGWNIIRNDDHMR